MDLIECTDLTVRGTRGTAVGPVSFVAPYRRPVAVLGPAGAGKSTLLLALVGRMRGVQGQLHVAGCDGVADTASVRRVTSVARIDSYVDVESTLSLEDCLTERTLFDGARPRDRHDRFTHAAELLGLVTPTSPLAMDQLVDDLSPLQRTQLCVALACVRPAELVVIDDVDTGLSLEEQRRLWHGFASLSAEGPVVAAGTREHAAIPAGVTCVDLCAPVITPQPGKEPLA